MAVGVHKITENFETELCRYTGAKYAVALDNCSNAIFLALYYELYIKSCISWCEFIDVPSNTYPAVPCEVIHAGMKINFIPVQNGEITGAYQLNPLNIWDSALSFTHNMYIPGQHMCLSFTGPYKTLKLGKGGAIITDNEAAYKWFKKARFSGRDECSYHVDDFDKNPVIGWNFYMMPEIAARGLLLMSQFYEQDGTPRHCTDLTMPYPDLSKFKIYNTW